MIIIKTLFQEATHLTTRQSSMRASNDRKQLTNDLRLRRISIPDFIRYIF